jgi:predicted hotdog family 3-hydroxylacyl-ACP dehydratase
MLRPGHFYTLPQVLPHGPGMMLLDRVAGYDAESLSCEVTIRPESRFCDGQAVPAWVGLEYMAQTLGAFTGVSRLQRQRPVQVELLLGTRSFECTTPAFAVGSKLAVRARLLFWDPDGVCAFACEIRQNGAVVATAEVKGFEPEDIEPFLRGLQADTVPANDARGPA